MTTDKLWLNWPRKDYNIRKSISNLASGEGVRKMTDRIISLETDFFKALAHPTRLRILERLAIGEVCVCEFIEDLELEQSNISQHLAILRKQNIIVSNKVGMKVMYRIKHPEVLEVLNVVRKVLTKQLKENEDLIKQLSEQSDQMNE